MFKTLLNHPDNYPFGTIIRFPDFKNIILDTKIIKISQIEPKIKNKVDALILDDGHFEKSNMAATGS